MRGFECCDATVPIDDLVRTDYVIADIDEERMVAVDDDIVRSNGSAQRYAEVHS
jgi:hypothetical protein